MRFTKSHCIIKITLKVGTKLSSIISIKPKDVIWKQVLNFWMFAKKWVELLFIPETNEHNGSGDGTKACTKLSSRLIPVCQCLIIWPNNWQLGNRYRFNRTVIDCRIGGIGHVHNVHCIMPPVLFDEREFVIF